MAVTAYWFAPAFISAFDKEIDYLADTIKMQLHTSSYTPNQDTHVYHGDLSAEVANSNGYSTGGVTLGTKSNSSSTNVVTFYHANPVWTSTSTGFTARIAVTLDTTPGSSGTNPLLWWMDFGENKTPSGGGTLTISMSGGQAATITAANAP